MEPVIVAAVQATPVSWTERSPSTLRAHGKSAAEGAGLIVFPEACVPGYPDWMSRTEPWADRQWYERLSTRR